MPEATSSGQRFIQLIQQLGLSKNAFAQSLGKTATVIQHLVDERNKPGFDLLNRVLEVYPNVSSDWLLLGQGTMFRPVGLAGFSADAVLGTPSAPAAIDLVSVAGPPRRRAPVASPLLRPADIAATVALAAHSHEAAAEKPASPTPPAASPTEPPVAPEESLPTPTPAAPLPGLAVAAASPAVALLPDPAYLAALLQAQHLQHQLALAEQRNQHLLEQQALLRQLVEVMQNR